MVERGGDETLIWQSRYSGRNLMFGPNPERPRRVGTGPRPCVRKRTYRDAPLDEIKFSEHKIGISKSPLIFGSPKHVTPLFGLVKYLTEASGAHDTDAVFSLTATVSILCDGSPRSSKNALATPFIS